jgi:hypothetical protein
MPFGVANTLTSFQNINKDIFKGMINLDVITYINNIFIYSQIKKEYDMLINKILSHLQKWNLATSIDKYKFYKSTIKFLANIIFHIGINIAQNQV